jgi:putative ABC transport system substrate-binding protein
VEVSSFNKRGGSEIERAITNFARSPNGGLIVTAGGPAFLNRELIIMLAAQHKLPAIYFDRAFVGAGGLLSYGPDRIDLYRRAAGYVDRILKGEKPANMPVQAPTKYQLVINLNTAKALGLHLFISNSRRVDRIKNARDVRFWPKADISSCTAHVRFRVIADFRPINRENAFPS